MHERTQRAIARLMFVFCCAIPTAVTLSCVVATWTPWYHRHALEKIMARASVAADMIVEIDDFHRDSPTALRLFGVRVLDSETRREVASVREVLWVSRSNGTSILLHQPELQSSQLLNSWHLIHDRFLCRPERSDVPIKFAANDLTIQSRTGALTLRDVDAWIEPNDQSVDATIQCLPADSKTGSPIRISLRRDRQGETPSTRWTLDTNGTPLPCSALAEFLPLMQKLGDEAEFLGSLAWQSENEHWWIDLGGSRFDNISLDRLLEDQSHRLTGTASVGLDRCRIEPTRRRSDIVGSIKSTDGYIGQSLLLSAHRELGFQLHVRPEIVDTRGDVPYDRLALGFSINDTVLLLNGICRMDAGYERLSPDVVVRLGLEPLVRSSDVALDSLKLITTIAPPHSVDVPVSSQTSWLTQILIPPSRPQVRDKTFAPRISSIRSWTGGPNVVQPNTSNQSAGQLK